MSSQVYFDSNDLDIAEVSPNGIYVRYHEIVVDERDGKVGYKGFDEDNGRDVTWNKIRVVDSSKADQLLQDFNQLVKPLKHKNIVECLSVWVDHKTGHINLITEAFTSGCLRKYREKHKSVETYAIKKWVRQILEGLCYLHTHDPLIVHGSLTCDDIFINGNTGEVKIGYPKLETIVQDPLLELFEEFSEDFDIYSLGICLLELATSHNPFISEFETLGNLYRKRGTKMIALDKVKDEQFKFFIEKCLDSRSLKLSAKELLKDSFLEMDISTTCSTRAPLASSYELKRTIGKSEFRLRGEGTRIGLVLFRLGVHNPNGQKMEVEFEFDPLKETTLEVATEMIDAFNLSSVDVNSVTELMDCLVVRLATFSKPSRLGLTDVMQSHRRLVPAV